MTEASDEQAWIARAEEDYQLVIASLRRKHPLTYGATFHAQQCAEKYLKAILTRGNIRFPRTHDLAALAGLCHQNGFSLPFSDDDLELLSAYAVEVRYPGLLPTIEEARDALRIVRAIRRHARKRLRRGY